VIGGGWQLARPADQQQAAEPFCTALATGANAAGVTSA